MIGTSSTAAFLLTTLILVITSHAVAGIHPKHKRLLQHSQNSMAQADADTTPRHRDEGTYYRIRRQNQRGQSYQISGFRQMVGLLNQLSSKIRSLENKLMRHESREQQVADFTAVTLTTLTSDHAQSKGTLGQMAKQLAAVEERAMATFALISNSDERQHIIMDKLSEGLDRLLKVSTEPALGRSPDAVPAMSPDMVALSMQVNLDLGRDVKTILRKMTELNGSQDSTMRGVAIEVRELSDVMSEQLTLVSRGQEGVLTAVQECSTQDASANTVESVSCKQLETEIVSRLESLTQMQQGHGLLLQHLKENTENAMGIQHSELQDLVSEMREEGSNYNGSFNSILEGLKELENTSHDNLGNLHANLKTVVENSGNLIQRRIDAMDDSLKEGQNTLMGALDDTASMTDNLQITVSHNYELLSKEISGLNKIEQVMINTADAVLDTKRSIEFGIQQVILELTDIVSKSGSTMNTTLSDQISSISFDIIKNQTTALSNMTRRMEGEISQVWRQIGIMYQQVEQSINMLDNLQDTTDQHMNVSLSRVGSMDGTVGEINVKVADVEDNLNYLLGRLSLVVSEFTHMKAGVGNELDRLREMAQEFSISDEENNENLRYNISTQKRHIIKDNEY